MKRKRNKENIKDGKGREKDRKERKGKKKQTHKQKIYITLKNRNNVELTISKGKEKKERGRKNEKRGRVGEGRKASEGERFACKSTFERSTCIAVFRRVSHTLSLLSPFLTISHSLLLTPTHAHTHSLFLSWYPCLFSPPSLSLSFFRRRKLPNCLSIKNWKRIKSVIIFFFLATTFQHKTDCQTLKRNESLSGGKLNSNR